MPHYFVICSFNSYFYLKSIITRYMTAIDFEIATKREKYINTIKELRLKNFSNDLPFLILSDKLHDGQVYREFPDGHIELHEVFAIGSEYKTAVLKILSSAEADHIRKENGLF